MNSIPAQHTAGDTFAASLSGSAYPPANGWQLRLVLIGPASIGIDAVVDGTDYAVAASPGVTATWVPGTYTALAVYTNTGQRQSVKVGAVQVLPDPTASGITARQLMSSAQQALEDLTLIYRAAMADEQFIVQEYTVAGRRMVFRSIPDILLALQAARRDVASELAAQRIAAGGSPRQQFITRM